MPIPEKRIKATKKASKTRLIEKSAFPGVSLKEKHKEQLMVMKFIENKEPDEILDEMFENYFTLQRDYKLTNHYTFFLSRFLRDVEKTGMDRTTIINHLVRLYKIGLGRINVPHFNKIMRISDHILKKNYSETMIDWLLLDTKRLLLIGNTKCTMDCRNEIINTLRSKQITNYLSIANDVNINLHRKFRNYELASLEELMKVMV